MIRKKVYWLLLQKKQAGDDAIQMSFLSSTKMRLHRMELCKYLPLYYSEFKQFFFFRIV